MSSALAKLFEGILLHRLIQYTEIHNTLTENQLGTRPGRQVHDAIYILLSVIQYNLLKKGKPTYVAFLDYSTASPSVFKVALLSLLQKFNIVGKMWKHLRARFRTVEVRVLHPQIPPDAQHRLTYFITSWLSPHYMSWLSKQYTVGSRLTLQGWQSWFCQHLGIAPPALAPYAAQLCSCQRQPLDIDHLHTCTKHSGH